MKVRLMKVGLIKVRLMVMLGAVVAIAAAFGGVAAVGATDAPRPLDIRVLSSSVTNLDPSSAPQGGTRTQFRVTLKNYGTNKAAVNLNADGGYDYETPNASATCSAGGKTFGSTSSCNWLSATSGPSVVPGAMVTMTVRTSIEGLETQNPGTLLYQFCINANDSSVHSEHRCFVLKQPGVLSD